MKLFIVTFLFFGGLTLHAEKTRAFESWLGIGIHQRLDYGLEIGIDQQEWLSSSSRSPILRHFEINPAVTWHYSPRYDFFLGYEREIDWSPEEKTVHTDLATSGFVLLLPLGKWDLRSQQRFDTGATNADTVANFRHLARVAYRGFSSRWAPFISNECFFNLIQGDLNQNRFMTGLEYQLTEALALEIYGMRHDQWESEASSTTPIFGINLHLSF